MEEVLPDSFSIQFNEGEQLQIHTPGGGGYGDTPNKDTSLLCTKNFRTRINELSAKN